MHNIKAIFAGLVAASVSMASISGKVTDTSGTAIPGALVQLEKDGQTDTTGTDGLFTLGGSTAIIPGKSNPWQRQKPSATIQNGLLWMNVAEKSAIEIAAFDFNGKALSRVWQTMDAGIHSIALTQRGSGIYLYKVKAGNNEFVLKSNSTGGISVGTAVLVQGISSNIALAKQAKVTAVINDVIAVTKTGYLNYRVVVYNSDTSGIEIKMIFCADTVRDIDGNLYQAVKIGNQIWTVENFRSTKYNDGTPIPFEVSNLIWHNAQTPLFGYYNDTTTGDSIKKFGALYNWYAISPTNPKKIAPAGWHVPSDSEWTIMENYLIANGYNFDGITTGNKIAKSLAAKTDWNTIFWFGEIGNDLTKNNKSGFSALPGGLREWHTGFGAVEIGQRGFWWSATEIDASNAFFYTLCDVTDYIVPPSSRSLNRSTGGKDCGFSVRLLRG